MSAQAAENQPDVAVRSARVGASDVAATAAFYQAVFGLKEIMRVERSELVEVVMNFGATVEEAKGNRAAGLVVIKSRVPLDPKAISPLIMDVEDIEGVAVKVTANGGTVDSPPKSYPYGFTISMVRDPSGNRIELVRQVGREFPPTVRS